MYQYLSRDNVFHKLYDRIKKTKDNTIKICFYD